MLLAERRYRFGDFGDVMTCVYGHSGYAFRVEGPYVGKQVRVVVQRYTGGEDQLVAAKIVTQHGGLQHMHPSDPV